MARARPIVEVRSLLPGTRRCAQFEIRTPNPPGEGIPRVRRRTRLPLCSFGAPEVRWHEPEVGAYPSEGELQRMIAESPSLLPGVDGPVAVASEFPCAFGRIDVVGVDLTGQIILCSARRRKTPNYAAR